VAAVRRRRRERGRAKVPPKIANRVQTRKGAFRRTDTFLFTVIREETIILMGKRP